ncbi:MAG: metal-sulfur cluster assembly factor [Propionibacteriaceae bacterium]
MSDETRPSDLVKDVFPDAAGDAPATPVVYGTEEEILEAMKDVIDPELMVNVVDLGLVYGVHIDEVGQAIIDMTLTTPTCPMTDRLEYQTAMALDGLVNAVRVNWVWLPPWDMTMISEDGREQLRAVGISV